MRIIFAAEIYGVFLFPFFFFWGGRGSGGEKGHPFGWSVDSKPTTGSLRLSENYHYSVVVPQFLINF